MKKQFKYPKSFEEQKKIPKITQKRIKLAEASLGDFEGRLENDLLNWFSLTPQHWIMLHMVMLAYYKNKSITKNELLKVIEKSYLTSNVYIDTAIKKGFFRIAGNKKLQHQLANDLFDISQNILHLNKIAHAIEQFF